MSAATAAAATDAAVLNLAPDFEPPADIYHAPPPIAVGDLFVHHAEEADIPAIVTLNNLYAPDGLTLHRSEAFVTAHLQDYQVIRDGNGTILGQVALDEYSPSLVELVSLAVAPEAQGRGIGQRLITAALQLAKERGYPELFAISLAEPLFLRMGFVESTILHYPEKIARYKTISRSELSIGRKFCFTVKLL
ncbi:MAG: GNAT family N-acetyltransferase [Gemmatimonadetes bacterium]|nr:GNAT family N-acetyltransferase [Gemmatimonadota bacterium]